MQGQGSRDSSPTHSVPAPVIWDYKYNNNNNDNNNSNNNLLFLNHVVERMGGVQTLFED